MRVKIVGIGKCGVRIAYDFFAYTSRLPLSYEIRLDANDGVAGIDTAKAKRLVIGVRTYLNGVVNEVNGLYRIAENPLYVTIDSDIDSNEILKRPVLFEDRGGKVTFPGSNYRLNDYECACNVHVVSESLGRKWTNIPSDITSSDSVNIYVTSFSIAGGTGGGSAPVICRASREGMNDPNRCHHMGLGILPKSDERYWEDETLLSMADYEKFNTGRFFASIYGNRFREDLKSLWLFSNDALRFFVAKQNEKESLGERGGNMKLNLSLVNALIAQSLTVLSNSSSRLSKADANVDSSKLNDILDGRPFMSALSQRHVASADLAMEHQVLTVKQLLLGALRNVTERDGQLEGLSVPVQESDLRSLQKILKYKSGNCKRFFESFDKYDATEGPIEFWTTWRFVMLYGQPRKLYSKYKQELLMGACEKIFPNAQKFLFTFQHHGSIEILLLFLVDPFIRPVVASVYYYTNNAWSQSGNNFTADFDALIGSDAFHAPEFLDSKEEFPHHVYGGGFDDVKKRVEANPSLAIERKALVTTFRHLHEIYHRKRQPMGTSSGLG